MDWGLPDGPVKHLVSTAESRGIVVAVSSGCRQGESCIGQLWSMEGRGHQSCAEEIPSTAREGRRRNRRTRHRNSRDNPRRLSKPLTNELVGCAPHAPWRLPRAVHPVRPSHRASIQRLKPR